MIEAQGDLWTYPADTRCITTNGIVKADGRLVMGAGVALEAVKRFPDLNRRLGAWIKLYGNRPFYCIKTNLVSFPTKHHWKDKSDLKLIVESARLVVALTDKFGFQSVALPRPGCGMGGLSWLTVKTELQPILDDRFIVVTP